MVVGAPASLWVTWLAHVAIEPTDRLLYVLTAENDGALLRIEAARALGKGSSERRGRNA